MTSQTLGRRNAAPVQGTELDLSSQRLVPRYVRANGFVVRQAEGLRKCL